jgi:hypothetical protein
MLEGDGLLHPTEDLGCIVRHSPKPERRHSNSSLSRS